MVYSEELQPIFPNLYFNGDMFFMGSWNHCSSHAIGSGGGGCLGVIGFADACSILVEFTVIAASARKALYIPTVKMAGLAI
jgi:hypothetical protein